MSTAMGTVLRSLVQVEPLGIDQMTYDDYVRSLPNPNIAALLAVPPLPGGVLLEMSVGFALQLVDRMLGGRGVPVEPRRPTDLEVPLIRDLVGVGVRALNEALEPLLHCTAELGVLETNPQMVQVTSPSDMVLLLSYRMTVAQGEYTEGLLTLCYPSATLAPVLERLSGAGIVSGDAAADANSLAEAGGRMAAYLEESFVQLAVRLSDSQVRARDLLALQAGDVLRLDHRVGQPVVAKIGETAVLRGHLGRRGRRLALQVAEVVQPPPPVPDAAGGGPVRGAHSITHPLSEPIDAPGASVHVE